ncbi:unnamed protein product [Porites lobata]|uniref:Uncharacterized protein n=1 Tax=Porites lobata TaxID=104759 RepID=A0ABN8Q4Q3_9CNID|nr:unnamed protein product [Porites lobata]
MASTIQSFLDNGRAYDMSSLLTMYQHILKSKGIDADSYTKHKLKLRMQSHFGDDIVFHQQFDKKKPELVYSSKISLQDVINSAALELHTSNKQVISDEANARNCIFEAAKIIKHEIKECKGISTRPLDVSDLNEETVRRLVPNDLYWLLRWIIGPTLDIEDTSTIDDKKVLSIAQDIIHCSSNARVKTPKHVSLAMSTHHLTGSKQIIILLNRMGHCISYDEMKSVDASLATEAFFRLSWKAFEKWLLERPIEEQPRVAKEEMFSAINDCRKAIKASVTTALKEMYAIRDSDRMGTHKESQPKRVQRDEEDVKKLIACFSSNLMTNPFECDADNQLLNIATGVVLPPESAQRLLESTEIGKKNMEAFIQDRLNTNKVSFWEPLKQLKIKTFASTKKKITLKSTNEKNGCDRVDIVFDQYRDMSIKSHERSRRGSSSALEVKINSPSTPVPKQWAKYISNPRNKTNLCTFLTQALSELGKKKLPQGKCLVIGGGCSDGESSLHIRRDHPTVTLSDLQANHEEADTRLLFHAKHASQPDSRIIIHSPDTDVLVLGISFYDELGCKELWLRTGSKDRLRYIPLHEISTKVGPKICKALPAFHALTGSDATSAFAGVGKKRAYNILEDSEVHQESLSQLGQITLTEDEIKQCVKFVFSLYPTTKKTPSSLDELRYLLFCQKTKK